MIFPCAHSFSVNSTHVSALRSPTTELQQRMPCTQEEERIYYKAGEALHLHRQYHWDGIVGPYYIRGDQDPKQELTGLVYSWTWRVRLHSYNNKFQ